MELQFDKEIDAILRRARGTEAVTPTADGSHLDADTINAFVENAMPERARAAYTAHFADCGRCRKLLSSSISLNTAAVSAADIAAESLGGATAVVNELPWYAKLFRTPGLALVMGAFVIVFSGVLGYMFLANRGGSSPNVAQMKPDEMPVAAPAYSSNSAASAANATSNSAANTAAQPDLAASPEPNIENPRSNGGPSPLNSGTSTGSATTTDTITPYTGGVPGAGQPLAAPPPPPITAAKPAPREDKEKEKADVGGTGRGADDKDEATVMRKMEDRSRDLPAAASKTGPSRAGPVQNQSNSVNQQFGEMTVTRGAGGKTFTNRDGAWYDNAYHGQSTTNVRRGTEEFNKLDKGLRSIANQIGGVVVVVWSSKAYRIQ